MPDDYKAATIGLISAVGIALVYLAKRLKKCKTKNCEIITGTVPPSPIDLAPVPSQTTVI